MEIILKNGEKVFLEISALFLEYMFPYNGGIEGLLKDSSSEELSKKIRATNQLIYAIVKSSYDMDLTYRQAVCLIKIEDIPRIIKFISQNSDTIKKALVNQKDI